MEDLIAKAGAAAIPEEGGGFPSEVEQWHGVALGFLPEKSEGLGGGVSEGVLSRMARGAGGGGVFGERGFEEESATEANAFFSKGKIGWEVGVGKIARHREGVGGAYLVGCGGFRLGCALGRLNGGEGEGVLESLLQVGDEGISGTGVSSGSFGDAEGCLEQAIKVESELIESVGVDGAVEGEGKSILVAAIMVGESQLFLGELTLDCEKNIATLKGPVKIVVEGVESVSGRILIGIGVVDVGGGAKVQGEALDAFLG